ncbi:MAG: thioesterase [Thermobacillus sp.]|nr:MAG: thioesterase [Thermobacillus sp.]
MYPPGRHRLCLAVYIPSGHLSGRDNRLLRVVHPIETGAAGGSQIICFPYLGGYANSFLNLADKLDDSYELWALNPPGHGSCRKPPAEDMTALLDLIIGELKSILRPGGMLFGHSMGGMVAYFLAQRLTESCHPTLILSACTTPAETRRVSHLPDDRLIEHLASYGGIPQELMHERSLLHFFLPVFRADFKVLESASSLNRTPLACPAYLLWGGQDRIVPLSAMLRWTDYFSGVVHLVPVRDGGHMFISDNTEAVADILGRIGQKQRIDG